MQNYIDSQIKFTFKYHITAKNVLADNKIENNVEKFPLFCLMSIF